MLPELAGNNFESTSTFGGFLWFFSGEDSFADDDKALRFFRRGRPASSSRSVSKAEVSSACRSFERAALYVSKKKWTLDICQIDMQFTQSSSVQYQRLLKI
jgi:hypothetical protein